jgi:hypothetical protein
LAQIPTLLLRSTTTRDTILNPQISGQLQSFSVACACVVSLGRRQGSPTTPTGSSSHLRIQAKISSSPSLDNRSVTDLERRRMVLPLREIRPPNRSKVHCVYFAYYRVIRDILLVVCSTSTRADVLPWTKFLPILGFKMPTCVDRRKVDSAITLLGIPMFWSPAVRLRHRPRSRGRGRGMAMKATPRHAIHLWSFGQSSRVELDVGEDIRRFWVFATKCKMFGRKRRRINHDGRIG